MPSAPTEQEAPRLTLVMFGSVAMPRAFTWLLPLRSHAVHHGVVLQGQALLYREGQASIHPHQPGYRQKAEMRVVLWHCGKQSSGCAVLPST